MKKITFFVHNIYTVGGVERVLSLIANELSKKYDVEIISLYKTAEKPYFYINENIKISNVLSNKVHNPKTHIFYLIHNVKKILKNYKTDYFVATGMVNVPLTIFMRKQAKYIAWEHGNTFGIGEGKMPYLGRKLAAKYADKIIVLTKRDMGKNIKTFKTANKITQIYNPIENVELSKEYNIESKKIVSSGRLCPQKGFDMLIDVAKKVFEKHPDWEWHIYGEGPDRKMLEQMIEEKKLQKNVKLMGRTDKMNEKYKEYAIFVMTSRFEGFAMVNIEAHYAKLPIVSFNCNCGPDEIIQDGVNGYLVDCFDIDKMSEKINYLIENSDVRIEMSQKTSLDKEKLEMKNIINEWEKLF